MPGPLFAFTLSATSRYGFWTGPLLILGHGILELALILTLVLGLSHFVKSDFVTSVVGIIGGAALVYMGFTIARQGWRKAPMPLAASGIQTKRIVLSGILVSLSNPFWLIWWATVGTTYLLWSLDLGAAGVASFFTGHILADLSWYALVASIVSTGRRAMTDRVYDGLLIFCGIALVGLGGYFVVSGIRFVWS